MTAEQGPQDGIAYTPEEAAVFMRTTPGALRKQANRRKIQFTWVGGEIRFTKADMDANLEAGRVLPGGEVPQNRLAPARSRRRTSPSPLPSGVGALKPRPDAARRRRAS